MSDTLYDTDFYEWTREQSRRLREAASERINLPIDWENVAEEIESLGKSDRRALASHVATILEHLMKLQASPAAEPRSGWIRTIRTARSAVDYILEDSPSLRREIPRLLARALDAARANVADALAEHAEPPCVPLDGLAYTEEQVIGTWLP